ncbi:MAG TPA: hypothetical protein VGF71_13280 [Caulobacteraceae bacterium]
MAAAAVGLAAGQQAAVRVAESYIEDTLKDPFSARFRHVTVRVVSDAGSRGVNVCGYVYAKNGYGVYTGGSQFVVGVKNGKATGFIWDNGDQEASVIFGSLGDGVCDVPFSNLESKRRAMVYAEVYADVTNHDKVSDCFKTFSSELAAAMREPGYSTHDAEIDAAKKRNAECLSVANVEWQQAYSHIFGPGWSGQRGLHYSSP